MLLNVSVLTPKEVIFEGTAKAVILPGEEGVFEILPYHKNIVSRLVSGNLFIDNEKFFIKRGVMKSYNNNLVIIVEQR